MGRELAPSPQACKHRPRDCFTVTFWSFTTELDHPFIQSVIKLCECNSQSTVCVFSSHPFLNHYSIHGMKLCLYTCWISVHWSLDVGGSHSVSCLTQHCGPTTIKLLLMVYREEKKHSFPMSCVFFCFVLFCFYEGNVIGPQRICSCSCCKCFLRNVGTNYIEYSMQSRNSHELFLWLVDVLRRL